MENIKRYADIVDWYFYKHIQVLEKEVLPMVLHIQTLREHFRTQMGFLIKEKKRWLDHKTGLCNLHLRCWAF